jgi:intein/homing endonuclease
MKAPPEKLSFGWAKFFVGVFFGSIISWLIFIYMHGVTQEQQVVLINKLNTQIKELETSKSQLIENQQRLNEENKKSLTVQGLKISIINSRQYKLSQFTTLLIVNDVKNDLSHLLTQDIRSVSRNRELLRRAIENKVYAKDDRRFKLEIDTIYFDTILEITLKIKSSK